MIALRAYHPFAATLRLCLFLTTLAGSLDAIAAPGIVLGDSIGVGVSMASGLPRLARSSATIRSASAIEQVRRTPHDTVAFLSLGTNDAVASVAGITDGIDRIVAAAQRANVNLVWIGPVCVRKSWNTNVIKLDELLRQRLAGRVRYVSLADQELCDPILRGRDGVHFNMRGYQLLWRKARAAAGVDIETASPDADLPAATKPSHIGARKMAQKSSPPLEPPKTAERSADGGSAAGVANPRHDLNR